MNELQIFNNNNFGEIRTLEENGKVLFCGRDIAVALGYKDTVNALKTHCKEDGVAIHHLTDSIGRTQQAKFINEGNLYRLIVNSKLPTAEKFERWVFEDVLPTIRKHGMYATDELLNNPDLFISVLQNLKDEREKNQQLHTENLQQKQMLAEYSPKASYYDVVLQTADVVSATLIAKDYGKSARWLNNILHDNKVQFKQGGVWLLYQKYADKGYTKTKTDVFSGTDGKQHSTIHTYWKQKGRLFIYDLLKGLGIYPLIETE